MWCRLSLQRGFFCRLTGKTTLAQGLFYPRQFYPILCGDGWAGLPASRPASRRHMEEGRTSEGKQPSCEGCFVPGGGCTTAASPKWKSALYWMFDLFFSDFILSDGWFGTGIIQQYTKWSQIGVYGLDFWQISEFLLRRICVRFEKKTK